MQAAFVPKNRRPKFELHLRIHDLNNIPLVSGAAYVKWHLPSSISAEHRGHTPKAPIKEHKVFWDYSRVLQMKLTIDRNAMLQDSDIEFEVLQEYGRNDRISLGRLTLNLASYVDADAASSAEDSAGGGGGVVRRYLMRDSKINSTLKLGIRMVQLDGERNYSTPPLRTAAVFGGIAGVLSGNAAEAATSADGTGGASSSTTGGGGASGGAAAAAAAAAANADSNSLLTGLGTASSSALDLGEEQDQYRRNLAASWWAQAGELPADDESERRDMYEEQEHVEVSELDVREDLRSWTLPSDARDT
ncbi:MAG: hypothetical protein M1824_005190 [Vezdaea acicularis]|nr:MAG: hypothetical protein M1824_005190 [Vezdaea acicularis]